MKCDLVIIFPQKGIQATASNYTMQSACDVAAIYLKSGHSVNIRVSGNSSPLCWIVPPKRRNQ